MFKKCLLAALLGLTVSTVQAMPTVGDAPTMIKVTGNMSGPFAVDRANWGYQFNNAMPETTGIKPFFYFIASVDSASKYPVQMQCWHNKGEHKDYTLNPGQSQACSTNDSVRLVTADDYNPALGNYRIEVRH